MNKTNLYGALDIKKDKTKGDAVNANKRLNV